MEEEEAFWFACWSKEINKETVVGVGVKVLNS